ncbi:Hypothetical predicted protein [Paramuricea clavata]|uniref:Uncharacterized protein n=1 Tax=Paramuricea clavata TaxID=317549 RepID=A0A7D9JH02_PARCT|nr:Hypothetical predicted protein [Paramuricea clavata]
MAFIKKITVCVLILALYAVFFHVEANECYSDYSCPSSQYCCSKKYSFQWNICSYSCVGLSCSYDSNCAPGESCCESNDKCALNCIGESCSYNSDCASGESCCESNDKCALNCIGKFCSYDSDCGSGESCCQSNYKCAFNCIGESCSYDSDCASGESCCHSDGVCKTGGCNKSKGWPGWLFAIIIITTVGSFILFLACVIYRRCYAPSRRRALGGVIVVQPMNTGATVFAPQQKHYGIQQQGQPMFQCSQPQGTAWPPPGRHATTPTY